MVSNDRNPGPVALLHHWLVGYRGGERVLRALGELFPGAEIFTHAFRGDRFTPYGSEADRFFGHPVRESFIASLPFGRRKPQMYLPLMPKASRSLPLASYRLLITSESGLIKGIRKSPGARHLCYCHTPMRYVWDMYDEYYRETGPLGKLAMPLFVKYIRREDLKSAECVDEFVANSAFVAERIRRIYGRDARVVHPPVEVEFFSASDSASAPAGDYYLFAGAPVRYKRLDLAKAACERLGRKLVVAGGGSCTDEELRRLYAGARALVFPGLEDFGIVPVEAQAAGTPVIAFGKGGALETVVNGRTGIHFPEQSVEALSSAIEEFEGTLEKRRAAVAADCRANAARFSKSRFLDEMRAVIGI